MENFKNTNVQKAIDYLESLSKNEYGRQVISIKELFFQIKNMVMDIGVDQTAQKFKSPPFMIDEIYSQKLNLELKFNSSKIKSIQEREFVLRHKMSELQKQINNLSNERTSIIANAVGVKVNDIIKRAHKRYIIKGLYSKFDCAVEDVILLKGRCIELKADGTVNKKARETVQTIKVIKNNFLLDIMIRD